MKKISFLLNVAIVASAFAFYGCSKENDSLEDNGTAYFDVKIGGMEDDNNKAVFTSADYSNLVFEDGDVIKVNGVNFTLRYRNGTWKAVGNADDMTNATNDTLLGENFYCYYGQSPATASPLGTSQYGIVSFASNFDTDPDIGSNAKRGSAGIVLAGLSHDTCLYLYPSFAVIRIKDRSSIYNHIEIGFEGSKVLKSGYVTPVSSSYPSISSPTYLTGVSKSVSTTHGHTVTKYNGDFLTASNSSELNGAYNYGDDSCNYSYHVIVPLAGDDVTTTIYAKCNVTNDGNTWTDYYKFENKTLQRGHVYTLDLDW